MLSAVVLVLMVVNVLSTGMDSALTDDVHAQSDLLSSSPEEIGKLAKDFLSTLMELRNQSDSDNISSSSLSTLMRVLA